MGRIIDIKEWKLCKALEFLQNTDIKLDIADDDYDEYSICDAFEVVVLLLSDIEFDYDRIGCFEGLMNYYIDIHDVPVQTAYEQVCTKLRADYGIKVDLTDVDADYLLDSFFDALTDSDQDNKAVVTLVKIMICDDAASIGDIGIILSKYIER